VSSFVIIKFVISALIIVLVSEIARKYTAIGGLIVAMPTTTILTMFWLYQDNKDSILIANFLTSVTQGIFVTFVFFIPCIILLKKGMNFYSSMFISLVLLTIAAYIQQKYFI